MLCAQFRAKQTNFDPLNGRKCQKHLKKPQKRNLARNINHMIIDFDSNHFNTLTYTE